MKQMIDEIYKKVQQEYDTFVEKELQKTPLEILNDSEEISLYKQAVGYFLCVNDFFEESLDGICGLEASEIQTLHQMDEIIPSLWQVYWNYDTTPALSYDGIEEMLHYAIEEEGRSKHNTKTQESREDI